MATPSDYKTKHVEVLVERAFNIRWTPEIQRRDEEDLETLWTRLSSRERAELSLWLAQQTEVPELD